MKNLNDSSSVKQIRYEETIKDDLKALPTMIEYYRKNARKLDDLTKIIIINSLLKSVLDCSMIFHIERKTHNVN